MKEAIILTRKARSKLTIMLKCVEYFYLELVAVMVLELVVQLVAALVVQLLLL